MNELDTVSRKPGRSTFDSSNTRHTIARILAALQAPQTHKQLRAALHMSERTLRRYVSHLKSEPNRRVRTASFLLLRNVWIPVIALGSQPDAVKPRQGEKERCAKYRANVKSNPEMLERRQQQNKARWLIEKPKTPNAWFGPLPGARAIQQGAQP